MASVKSKINHDSLWVKAFFPEGEFKFRIGRGSIGATFTPKRNTTAEEQQHIKTLLNLTSKRVNDFGNFGDYIAFLETKFTDADTIETSITAIQGN